MFAPYLILALLQITSPDPEVQDMREYQYKKKIEEIEHENLLLKSKLSQLKAESKKDCPFPTTEEAKKAEATKIKVPKTTDSEAYRSALRLVQTESWQDAILAMENFVRDFPKSDLADHALFWIAQVYLQESEARLAKAELERLIELYPNGDRVRRAQTLLDELAKNPSVAARSRTLSATMPSAVPKAE